LSQNIAELFSNALFCGPFVAKVELRHSVCS